MTTTPTTSRRPTSGAGKCVVQLGRPRRGLAGQYRFNVHPNRSAAALYTWTQVGGRMVDRRMIPDLALPSTDLTSATLQVCRIETIIRLDTYRLRLTRPDLEMDVTWTAFMPAIHLDYNIAGATVAQGHYQTLGRARVNCGSTTAVWRSTPTASWIIHGGCAVGTCPARAGWWRLRSNLFRDGIPILTDQGKHMVGYVMDHDVLGA